MSSGRQKAASKARLLEQFERMYEELHTWREAHPEASFDEIASQVTPLRRVLFGELLEQQRGGGDHLAGDSGAE